MWESRTQWSERWSWRKSKRRWTSFGTKFGIFLWIFVSFLEFLPFSSFSWFQATFFSLPQLPDSIQSLNHLKRVYSLFLFNCFAVFFGSFATENIMRELYILDKYLDFSYKKITPIEWARTQKQIIQLHDEFVNFFSIFVLNNHFFTIFCILFKKFLQTFISNTFLSIFFLKNDFCNIFPFQFLAFSVTSTQSCQFSLETCRTWYLLMNHISFHWTSGRTTVGMKEDHIHLLFVKIFGTSRAALF